MPGRGPDIPDRYGETRLVLLPRDAEWVYSYWELAPEAWARAERAFRQSSRAARRGALRFRVAGARRREQFLVEVSLDDRETYVPSPFQGGKVSAELGLRLPDGRFAALAASNEIILPAGRLCPPAEGGAEIESLWSRRGAPSGFPGGAGPEPAEESPSRHQGMPEGVSSWPGLGGSSRLF
jgi:hypothetical protein